MNPEPNPTFPQIIIRQEVILPYPYVGVQISGTPGVQPAPAPPTGNPPVPEKPSPAPGFFGYTPYISYPDSTFPCSGTNYPQLNSDGTITVTGMSYDSGNNGPVALDAKCFTTPQQNPPPDSTWTAKTAASGQYLNPSWTLKVPPATLTGCNYLYVEAQFLGDTHWICANAQFPLNSSGSGSGFLVGVPGSSVTVEVPPPFAFAVEVPKDAPCSAAGSVIRVQYDNFCSTSDQPIWKSATGACRGEWMLKCCRYGERLIGMLILRQPGEGDRTWLSDQFMLDRANLLVHESHRSAAVRVIPE